MNEGFHRDEGVVDSVLVIRDGVSFQYDWWSFLDKWFLIGWNCSIACWLVAGVFSTYYKNCNTVLLVFFVQFRSLITIWTSKSFHFRSSSMDLYWELSDFDIHTRQQGMDKLLQSLKTLSTSEDLGKVNS